VARSLAARVESCSPGRLIMDLFDHPISRSVNLTFNAVQALGVPWLRLRRSLFGKWGSLSSAPNGFRTERAAFDATVDTAKRLLRVGVSLPVVDRLWRESSGPIAYPGQYAGAHPTERWLFINGICTDKRMAQLNAEMLSQMFCRPLTILYNATDGWAFDLMESAVGKGWDGVTEAAAANLDEVVAALLDPGVERVVLIAHSQGTILAAVFLKALEELLQQQPGAGARGGAGAGPVSPERRVARKLAGKEGAQPADARPAAEHRSRRTVRST
jgi:hypothetical protein